MPQNIGPDMLANLDRLQQAGEIDQHTYEARKAEVMELIRKGRAFKLSPGEKVARAAGSGALILIGLVFLGFIIMNRGNILGLIVAIIPIYFGGKGLRIALNH